MKPGSDGRRGHYEARGKIYYKTKFLHWGIKGLI